MIRNIKLIITALGMLCASAAYSEQPKEPALSKVTIESLLTLVSRKDASPDIYSAIYYPEWKKQLNGLKPVTAEAIAEHANEKMNAGVRLEIAAEPISAGDVAVVLLKRSGGGFDDGTFPAYLYRDGKNGWRFLGFPIPYTPPSLLGDDGKYRAEALNDPTPYDGVLYEFDDETIAKFKELARKLPTARAAEEGGPQKDARSVPK